MATPSLHPSIGPGIGSSLGSPGQLHSPISTLSSPINGMGPPFSVISSPMGPHSMSVPSTPSLGFGTSSPQLNSPMNSVTSTEDIKPPLGLNGVLKVPAHPSGTMASFTKHICAICGDRSSAPCSRRVCEPFGTPPVLQAGSGGWERGTEQAGSALGGSESSQEYRGTPCSTAALPHPYCMAQKWLFPGCKHYGVYSCEGCKGFFKRTVRKDLTYTCRDNKDCLIDKRQRNRCQYCRYQKCLAMGMKREAVQEERQRGKDRNENEVESTSSANEDMPVEKILEAELAVEPKTETYIEANMGLTPSSVRHHVWDIRSDHEDRGPNDPVTNICQAADKQLFTLVEWAKRIPHFSELPLDDQVILLRAGWNELLIASFSHRSIAVKDGILLATGLHVHRNSAHSAGVGAIFDRVLTELVSKMRDMLMDKTELGCLRAIVLFNPDSKGLSNPAEVEALREKVYASLEAYCKHKYPDQPGRFAKLLLRLPALRSIANRRHTHRHLLDGNAGSAAPNDLETCAGSVPRPGGPFLCFPRPSLLPPRRRHRLIRGTPGHPGLLPPCPFAVTAASPDLLAGSLCYLFGMEPSPPQPSPGDKDGASPRGTGVWTSRGEWLDSAGLQLGYFQRMEF
ncbi:hypothetical protein IHE44_0007235, partial [Lamprotornis superbus]